MASALLLPVPLPSQFKFGSPQKYEFSFSGVRPRSPGKTPKSPCTPSDVEEEETVESPEADIYFQPVVPLPPKVRLCGAYASPTYAWPWLIMLTLGVLGCRCSRGNFIVCLSKNKWAQVCFSFLRD